ncbi:hypothetical protein FQN50_006524, partial [Emmonsiellopsis sp. PD_5]
VSDPRKEKRPQAQEPSQDFAPANSVPLTTTQQSLVVAARGRKAHFSSGYLGIITQAMGHIS